MGTYQHIITALLEQRSVSETDVAAFFDTVLSGGVSETRLAAVLTGWAMREVSQPELLGLAKAVLKHAVSFPVPDRDNILDVVGTGGDKAGMFNVSTIAAIVCAAAGVPVAKHGNRAATSSCGSFDFLERAGIFSPDDTPARAQESLARMGIAFLFAPHYHPAFKYVTGVRKELGFPTIFNITGPLVNPARPANLLLGVAQLRHAELLGATAVALGATRVVCVHGHGKIDEVSVAGPTQISEFGINSEKKTYEITPTEMGLGMHTAAALAGGEAAVNVGIAEDVFANKATDAQRDFVLANSGAALYAAGKAGNIAGGVRLAKEVLMSDKPLQLYRELQKRTV